MEKLNLCDSCGRFDKSSRLEKACIRLLDEFLNSGNRELVVRGPECSVYWETYLPGLIGRKGLSINLRIVNGEHQEGVYNIADYCRAD